ncbi:S4 domain-containing protein [Ammonifex thiophilus]|uniref:RNA-binding S4 domain-containing protein n=1 Tax=Ammonifex thiophilus TaxID=444093 RepID=A0A3D8P7M7_9THEO|nr:S4 domain-containing protein [Ammonifex thiophilus]RDV84648.1 RNA-binding S4 domain-containing protein [Ammonifex thiophilus]
MRIDKFLKEARLITRRAVANQALREGLVTVNGRTAKPATRVKKGDIITLNFGGKLLRLEVLAVEVPRRRGGEEAALYRLLD